MEIGKNGLIYLYCVTDRVPKWFDFAHGSERLDLSVSASPLGRELEAERLSAVSISNGAQNGLAEELNDLWNLGDKLYFIRHRGIYAAVSKVKDSEFSEERLKKNFSDMNWVETKAREHIEVISRIMETSTVIPFKFCTIFETEDSLKIMLEDYSARLKDSIAKLDGKEEWSLKIYCDLKVLMEQISQISEKIKQIDEEILLSPPGKAFLLKKIRDELLKDAICKKISEYGQYCFEKLRVCAQEGVINRLLPKEVTEKENEMILNSAYLVSKEKVENFLNVVEGLADEYKKCGFEFDCKGPWPAYDFCIIKGQA